MEKVTFACETITPMLIHGADGSTPKPPPFEKVKFCDACGYRDYCL